MATTKSKKPLSIMEMAKARGGVLSGQKTLIQQMQERKIDFTPKPVKHIVLY